MTAQCAACRCGEEDPRCAGSFARAGVLKVHWETWSDCNLSCAFCYRTRGAPLETEPACVLLDAIAAAGAEAVVFAGGDPSLRRDLDALCAHAAALGLTVEIQTNAHRLHAHAWRALAHADLVGVSFDGHDAATHDAVRGRRDNFERATALLQRLDAAGTPVIVRSLVVPQTHERIHELAPRLAARSNVVRWSLVEFTAANDGYAQRDRFALDRASFDAAVERCRAAYRGTAEIDAYRAGDKRGTYALVTPDGLLYGTGEIHDGRYPTVGSMVEDHLATLIDRLAFEPERHRGRYAPLLAARR